MALVTRRCRDGARGSAVEFVIDTVLFMVVEIGVLTTSRAITISLTGPNGTVSRTQQPGLTRRYDVSLELAPVREDLEVMPDTRAKRRVVVPCMVQF